MKSLHCTVLITISLFLKVLCLDPMDNISVDYLDYISLFLDHTVPIRSGIYTNSHKTMAKGFGAMSKEFLFSPPIKCQTADGDMMTTTTFNTSNVNGHVSYTNDVPLFEVLVSSCHRSHHRGISQQGT